MNVEQAIPDCRALALELMQQPEFFETYRKELPHTPAQPVPRLALTRYTGGRAGADEQANLRVGAMRLLGLSDRAIERECGVDRRTIPFRLHALEKARRIPAVKARLEMLTGDLAERSGLVLSCLLDRAQDEWTVELAAMVKATATAFGITVEKLQLLTGSPTEIIGHTGTDGRAEIEEMVRQFGVPIDVEVRVADLGSVAEPQKHAATTGLAGHGPGPDTATARPSPSPEMGGGGRAGAGGAETPMGQ